MADTDNTMSILPAADSNRLTEVAALVAGAVVPLAFAPFGWWWFAIVGPAVLFRLWLDCPPRRAAWLGWLFGVGLWGAGVYWIYHSLHHFGSAIAPLAALITLVFALAMALTIAALGFVLCRGEPARRGVAWLLLLAPAAWIAQEWVRSWFLTGFPWLLLGTSQIDTPLAGYAPLVGVYGVGLVVAVTAGMLAALPRLRGLTLGVMLAVLAVAWGGGVALDGRDWSEPDGEALSAALVQGNVPQDEKFDSIRRSVDLYTDKTRVVAGDVDLVVWPETAIPTYWDRVAPDLNAFARELGATEVVTGIFTYDRDHHRYYNSVRPLGPARDVYSKQRLVPFGEYLPLRDWLTFLEAVIEIPLGDLAVPDAEQGVIEAAGVRLGAFVCYEAAYPRVVGALAPEAGILINVSNDAWFGDSTAPEQHLEIARMRSLETARPMLRATNTGISAFIDHHGEIGERGAQFEALSMTAEVQPRTGTTPYGRVGDWPVLGLLVLVIGGWILRSRQRRPAAR